MKPFLALLLLLAACDGPEAGEPAADNGDAARIALPEDTPTAAPEPARPGAPRRNDAPPAEEPLPPESAQGAAEVLRTYYALIGQGRYEEAWALRIPGPRGPSAAEFAASFADYVEYRAEVGPPSEMQGAAGSVYVEVPVQIYGRTREGRPFSSAGTVTMRRSNDVPGAAPAQKHWRIYTSG